MTEKLIKRMTWKAFFFMNVDAEKEVEEEKICFKSKLCPPRIEELAGFEDELMTMIEDVKFGRDDFQRKLKADLSSIKESNKIYELGASQYEKLLNAKTTKTYKHAPDAAYDDINWEARKIAENLNLAERMETMARKDAYITRKDHKENFATKLPC